MPLPIPEEVTTLLESAKELNTTLQRELQFGSGASTLTNIIYTLLAFSEAVVKFLEKEIEVGQI
ncbi:MAG: hypothetical protein ACREHG_01840 [Candidatus Saccharimonadales bacterium]